jgi:putative endopeptidase
MHWAAAVWATKKNVSRLGKPIDRTKWHMTPQTVNAYCDFVMNEIVFPAGILQKPFFDASWPEALNYGSIGAVIGHELTHAFDDQGAQFDATGNLKTWWTAADKKKFAAEAKKLVAQYNNYVVLDKMRCNGELTLGENIADIGGVAIAYDALARRIGKDKLHVRIGKHTAAQAFFLAYAQGWGGSIRPEEQRRRLITDPHAPSHLRVNAALPNLQEFHEAFDIQPGDKLYRKPEDRVSIW